MRPPVATFLLALLGCSLAEGWLVPKCELRDRLTRAVGDRTEQDRQRGLTGENLVAKIICHVELASGFNTSAVNELIPGMEDHHHHRRRRRQAPPHGGLFSLAEQEGQATATLPRTPERGRAYETSPPARSPHGDEEVWTLYGLFQLSGHLVCSDGATPSPNICGISCSNLVDDDIRDDISCLVKLLTNLVENGFGAAHWRELKHMIRFIFQESCRDETAANYFAECS